MKNVRIDLKITLWYAFFMVLILTSTVATLLYANRRVVLDELSKRLIHVVDSVAGDIRILDTQEEMIDNDDTYIAYQGKIIEIDDDYVSIVDSVKTAIYGEDHFLIYGNSLQSIFSEPVEFSEGQKSIRFDGKYYYVYDTKVQNDAGLVIWIRGVIEQTQGRAGLSKVLLFSVSVLPVIMLITIAAGYFLAKKTLQPIEEIKQGIMKISNGVDLNTQIDIGKGDDELHRLADSFNEMLCRLSDSFEREKQFSSVVSHELRTPMAVIMAESEYLLGESSELSKENYKEGLEVIHRQSIQMTSILNELLEFTRIGLKDFQRVDLNYSSLIENICSDMKSAHERQNTTLVCESEEHIILNGNASLLYRMLSNLIENAYKFSKEGGCIHVTLKKQAQTAVLSVKDNGIGMEAEHLKHIFEKFYRVNHFEKGTGIGLAMAKEIAKGHGGDIHVCSTYGEGSEFIITLPLIKL